MIYNVCVCSILEENNMARDLVGTTEAAEILKISRQHLYAIRNRNKNFPKPVAALAQGPVWRRKDIEEWKKQKEAS